MLDSLEYEKARTEFRKILEPCSLQQWRDSENEQLTTDVAFFGEPAAENLVVLSSGLHGVEGFMGSRAQLYWLKGCAQKWLKPGALKNCAVVVMHALNPFGFRFSRRPDANNMDLNRSFHFGAERPPEHKLFPVANQLLAPEQPPRRDGFLLRALWTLLRYDRKQLGAAIAGGQYSNRKGLFFGGQKSPVLQGRLEVWFDEFVVGRKTVDHIDLHSGLGPYAGCQVMLEQGITQHGILQARERWPDLVSEAMIGETEYEARGTLGSLLQGLAPRHAVDYRYYCAEFGTYGPLRVLSALRKENQAWFYLGPEHPHRLAAAAALRACFDPPDPKWQRTVCETASDLIERVIADFEG